MLSRRSRVSMLQCIPNMLTPRCGECMPPQHLVRRPYDIAPHCNQYIRYNRTSVAANVVFSQRLRLHIIGCRVGLSGRFFCTSREHLASTEPPGGARRN